MMRKTTIYLIYALVIAMLTSCSYTHSPICSPVTDEESTSVADSTDTQTDAGTLTWEEAGRLKLKELYGVNANPLPNEEMTKYGYDDSGLLVLPESELYHVEDTEIVTTGMEPSYIIRPCSDMFRTGDELNALVVVAEIKTLTSYCKRYVVDREATKDYPAYTFRILRGYTETQITVKKVLDFCNRVNNGEEIDFSFLEGKELPGYFEGYWCYDDDGSLKKTTSHLYHTSYVAAPGQTVVLMINYRDMEKFTDAESFYDWISSSEGVFAPDTRLELDKAKWVNSGCIAYYFPAIDQNGAEIETLDQFKDYLAWLDETHRGCFYPWAPLCKVTADISF